MRWIPVIAALIAGAGLAERAAAEGTIIVSPIYDQLVAVPVPAGYRADYEAEQDGSYILELVPQGETVDGWSQMITLTGLRGAAGQVKVEDFAGQIAEGYQNACPDTFAARALPAPKLRGAKAVFAGYLGCGSVGGMSEAMVFLVVAGASDIYTVQWAERSAAATAPPEPDPGIWKPRADALGLSRICDKVAGEAAPYPSCTE